MKPLTLLISLSIFIAPQALLAQRRCTPKETRLARQALKKAARYLQPLSAMANRQLAPVYQVVDPALLVADSFISQTRFRELKQASRSVKGVVDGIKLYTTDMDKLVGEILTVSGGRKEAQKLVAELKGRTLTRKRQLLAQLRGSAQPLVQQASQSSGQLASSAVGGRKSKYNMLASTIGRITGGVAAKVALDKTVQLVDKRVERVRKRGVRYLECVASPITGVESVPVKSSRSRLKSRRARTTRSRRALSGKPGYVVVKTSARGATLSVDGRVKGKTPISTLSLSPGRHRVQISQKGKRARAKFIQVRSGKRQVVDFSGF